MHDREVWIQVFTIVGATILLGIALLLLAVYKRLFSRVRNIWLRKNLATMLVAIVAMLGLLVLQMQQAFQTLPPSRIWWIVWNEILKAVIIVSFVFNTVWLVTRIPVIKRMSFIKHHAIVIGSIVVSAIFIYSLVYCLDHGWTIDKKLHDFLLYAYFNSICTGLVYTALNYVELDRKRKLNEKELEVTKLMALKTKAELEVLHSKINPHFLYNALNSIADLSVTDGRKARTMTVALADLFRYSINYSNHNYSTVKDEVEMAEIYLKIEKIRFEDQLNYSLNIDEDVRHYLIPRFILQPVVENAVKHGLKATGRMTEIKVEVKKESQGLVLIVADNGPSFPDEMMPGYGVKSIFDKLDLLFPGQYEVHFSNEPQKQVSIHIQKLMKDEPVV